MRSEKAQHYLSTIWRPSEVRRTEVLLIPSFASLGATLYPDSKDDRIIPRHWLALSTRQSIGCGPNDESRDYKTTPPRGISRSSQARRAAYGLTISPLRSLPPDYHAPVVRIATYCYESSKRHWPNTISICSDMTLFQPLRLNP